MSYACVRQHDQSDCGAAVLATVALRYKRRISVQHLRELVGADRVGASMSGLKAGAEQLGFTATGVKCTLEELPTVTLPAVAHITNDSGAGHFVVIHRVTRRTVTLADPAFGMVKKSLKEFAAQWKGILLLLSPTEEFHTQSRNRTGAPPGLWTRYFRLIKPRLPVLAEVFVISAIMTVLGLASAYFLQTIVDEVIVHSERRLLTVMAVGMLVLLAFRIIFNGVKEYLLAYVTRKMNLSLLSSYIFHVLALPLRFFETRRTGDIVGRVSDAGRINQLTSVTTIGVLMDGSLLIIFGAVMLWYDFNLALVVFASAPLTLIVILGLKGPIKHYTRKGMDYGADLQSFMVENVGGVDTIKALGAEEQRGHETDERLVRVVSNSYKLQMFSLVLNSLDLLVSGTLSVVVLWYGSIRVMDGALTVGQLMFFNTLMGNVLGPLHGLITANLTVQDGLIALDRLGELLDLTPEDSATANKIQFDGVRDGIVLRDVYFGYGSRGQVLKGVRLKIPSGTTVAIVGESGSGKTTLLKLLMRFYDPIAGSIQIDGRDMRDFSLIPLRSAIGYVGQDPHIFNGTVRENIRYGKSNLSMAEIVDAAKAAELDGFINSLPERYETLIGERGANLSGGQRQRLAIARALLARPELLIFDEATSHLDTQTEEAIRISLRQRLKGKTVVMVAHRLSTIRNADMIVVMADGRVMEVGNHAQLLAAGGRYAAFWAAQTGDGPRPAAVVPVASQNGQHPASSAIVRPEKAFQN